MLRQLWGNPEAVGRRFIRAYAAALGRPSSEFPSQSICGGNRFSAVVRVRKTVRSDAALDSVWRAPLAPAPPGTRLRRRAGSGELNVGNDRHERLLLSKRSVSEGRLRSVSVRC